MDLFQWFEHMGKQEGSKSLKPVTVRSCFGGMALYRASKFFDERCSCESITKKCAFSFKNKLQRKNPKTSKKYLNDKRKICEHLTWNLCMESVDKQFRIAVQPDMVTTYQVKRSFRNNETE